MTVLFWHRMAMFVITITLTDLLIFGFAFLLVFPVHFCNINLEALFPKNRPTLCFLVRVIFGPAPSHREFRTLFFEAYSFAFFVFLPAFSSIHCKTFFVECPIGFGNVQRFFGVFTFEIWTGITVGSGFSGLGQYTFVIIVTR